MRNGNPQAVDLAVDILAVYRLTRLATTDTIFDRPRYTLQTAHPFLNDLLDCPHCSGVWVAAGVAAARIYAPTWWKPLATILAVSGGQSLLSTWAAATVPSG